MCTFNFNCINLPPSTEGVAESSCSIMSGVPVNFCSHDSQTPITLCESTVSELTDKERNVAPSSSSDSQDHPSQSPAQKDLTPRPTSPPTQPQFSKVPLSAGYRTQDQLEQNKSQLNSVMMNSKK